jgi:alkylation response protein AidB-like acyl-CoA dehydrogenase
MHFGLTEERSLLQETLRHFATEELPAQRLRDAFNSGTGFDKALWHSAAGVGLQGLIVPEEYGGSALEMLDLALAFEVLGEAAAPGPFLGHALTTLALSCSDDKDLKEKWLPGLASGEVVGGCALADATDAWDATSWTLTEEAGRLHGVKRYAEAGAHTDLILVGLAGGALGLVDARGDGVRVEALDGHDRSRRLADVHFDGAAISRINGPDGIGNDVIDAASILLAADAFGAAWKLIRASVDYAQTREQFATPIAQFQAVKHQLANMAMEAEPMRGLLWHAAYVFDHNRDQASQEASTAKAHITDRVVQIGRDAVSIHGGIGFTWECDVHFHLKRAMHDRVWLGSPSAHRVRLADLAGW